MTAFKEKYKQEVVPQMKEAFGYQKDLAVPQITKVVINVGTSRALKDPKALDLMKQNLVLITGQKPIETRARRAISGFNIKEGMVVGLKVTLRGKRMYEFLDKLINVTLPRVRDFRGLRPQSMDSQGNCTIGIKECSVFPEIDPNKVELIHGVEVCLKTTAQTREEGLMLLKLLGFPFREGKG